MINHGWIACTTQHTTPPSSSHLLRIQEYFRLSGLYFQILPPPFDALSMHPYSHMQTRESAIVRTGLSSAAAPHRAPLWWCLGLLGLCYTPALTLLFKPLQSILPPPGCVWLCASLAHHLPPTVFGLADWATSFTLPQRSRATCFHWDKGKTWAAWSFTALLEFLLVDIVTAPLEMMSLTIVNMNVNSFELLEHKIELVQFLNSFLSFGEFGKFFLQQKFQGATINSIINYSISIFTISQLTAWSKKTFKKDFLKTSIVFVHYHAALLDACESCPRARGELCKLIVFWRPLKLQQPRIFLQQHNKGQSVDFMLRHDLKHLLIINNCRHKANLS